MMASTSKENNMIAENLKNDPWAQYLNIESEDSLISTKDTAVRKIFKQKISSEYMNFFKLQPFAEEFIVCRCKCLKTLLPPSVKTHYDYCPESANRIHSASHQSNQELKYPNGKVNLSKANGKKSKSRQQNNKRLHDVAPSTSNESIEDDRKSVKKPDPFETSLSGPGPGKKTSANSNFLDTTALVSARDTRLPKAGSRNASYQVLTVSNKAYEFYKETKLKDSDKKSLVNAHSNGLRSYDENAVYLAMDQIGLCINGTVLSPAISRKKVEEKQSLCHTGSDNLSAVVNGNPENNLECVRTNFSRVNIDHNTHNIDQTEQSKWQCCSTSESDFSTMQTFWLNYDDKGNSDREMETNAYSSPISSLENDSPTFPRLEEVGLNLHSPNVGYSQIKSHTVVSTCRDDIIKTSSPLSFSNLNEQTLDGRHRFSGDVEGCCNTDRNNILPFDSFAENVSIQIKQKSVCATIGECDKLNAVDRSMPFFSTLCEKLPEKRKAPSENLPSPKRSKQDLHQSDWVSLDNLSKCLDLENTEVQFDEDLVPSVNLEEVDSKRLPGQSSLVLPSEEPVLNFLAVAEEGLSKKLVKPLEFKDALRTYWLPYTSTKTVLNIQHSGNNPSKLPNSDVFHTPESSIPEIRCNINKLLNKGEQSGNSEDVSLQPKSTRLKSSFQSDASSSISLTKFSVRSSEGSPHPYHPRMPNSFVTGQTSASQHRVGKIVKVFRSAIGEEASRLKSHTKHRVGMPYVPVLHSSSDSGITFNGSERETDVECFSASQNDSSEVSSLPENITNTATDIDTQQVYKFDLPMWTKESGLLEDSPNDYISQSDSLKIASTSPIHLMNSEECSASLKDSSIDLTFNASPQEFLETNKMLDASMPNVGEEISRVFNKTVLANNPYHLEPLFVSKCAYPTTPQIIAPFGLRNNTAKGEKNRS